MAEPEPKVGDEVAWNWGSSHIEGEVAEKTDKKITKEIKGKPITKNGEPENPAYFVKQTKKKGNPVVKKASELELLESKGDDGEDDKQEGTEQEEKQASPKKGGKGKSADKGTGKTGKQSGKKADQDKADADKKDDKEQKTDGKKGPAKQKGRKAAAGDKHERDEDAEADGKDEAEKEEDKKADSKGKGSKAEPKNKKVKKTPPPTNQHVKTRAQVERKKKDESK